jgi:hypothetical protein
MKKWALNFRVCFDLKKELETIAAKGNARICEAFLLTRSNAYKERWNQIAAAVHGFDSAQNLWSKTGGNITEKGCFCSFSSSILLFRSQNMLL